MKVLFTPRSWEDFGHWVASEADVARKVTTLVQDMRRSPFKGLGKPEPLKGELSGWWSRRITSDHRLVYRVQGKGPDQRIEIAACRYHYGA